MYLHELEQRKCDAFGCGYYDAPRGKRKHKGVDLIVEPDTCVKLGMTGEVVKLGLAYSDPKKNELRYLSVDLGDNWYCRVFYIRNLLSVGDTITGNTDIGRTLSLKSHFGEGMTDHVHIECYKTDHSNIHDKRHFQYIDPNIVLKALRG